MEVGKLILNVVKNKATMTLSVKPFGCMPSSSVSDGVQSLITERYPGSIYCAVETSGDGAVNFQSRVQMYLFKAKQAAQAELAQALSETGLTLVGVQEYLRKNPRFASSLHHPPHRASTTTADLVYEVAEVIGKSRAELALARAQRLGRRLSQAILTAIQDAPSTARTAASVGRRASEELFTLAKDKAPTLAEQALGRAKQRLGRVLPFVDAEREQGLPVAAE